jgi:hypothetical protein
MFNFHMNLYYYHEPGGPGAGAGAGGAGAGGAGAGGAVTRIVKLSVPLIICPASTNKSRVFSCCNGFCVAPDMVKPLTFAGAASSTPSANIIFNCNIEFGNKSLFAGEIVRGAWAHHQQ